MRVLLQFGYVWGEDGRYLGPKEHLCILSTGVRSLRLSGVEIDVHIKTHPRFLDEWVDLLVRTYFVSTSCILYSVLRLLNSFVIHC